MLLGSRLWPTAGLGGGGTGGGGSGGAAAKGRSELREFVRELEACDPRLLEVAGVVVR